MIPLETYRTLQPLFSEDISLVTVVTQALIINVSHTVSALCAIFFYEKRLQIFTQLKKVIRVQTITNTTGLVNFQRWRYWRGFWYFLWLLNKFWFVDEHTINVADLICKFCEFSRNVDNYISWKKLCDKLDSLLYHRSRPSGLYLGGTRCIATRC